MGKNVVIENPVIVVCNNTNVSKLVFDYVAGWEKPLKPDKTIVAPGALPIFSNVADGQWIMRPNTILIDSEQLESGEAMTRISRRWPRATSGCPPSTITAVSADGRSLR